MFSIIRTSRLQTRCFSTLPPLFKANTPDIITTFDPKTQRDRITIKPIERHGETIEKKKARLVYQSRKRGILETDLLLAGFAKKYLDTFTMEELDEYDKILDHLDWDIYYWATKNYDISPLPEQYKDSKVFKLLQDHSENREREILRMPSLY